MTKDEIIKKIGKEELRIAKLENKIEAMKHDINACKGSIIFWEEQIKNMAKESK